MNLLLLSFMYDEHISTLVDLLINIPMSLSLDYHAQMYFMRGPNRHLKKKYLKNAKTCLHDILRVILHPDPNNVLEG